LKVLFQVQQYRSFKFRQLLRELSTFALVFSYCPGANDF
jgi:hypothetical protein